MSDKNENDISKYYGNSINVQYSACRILIDTYGNRAVEIAFNNIECAVVRRYYKHHSHSYDEKASWDFCLYLHDNTGINIVELKEVQFWTLVNDINRNLIKNNYPVLQLTFDGEPMLAAEKRETYANSFTVNDRVIRDDENLIKRRSNRIKVSGTLTILTSIALIIIVIMSCITDIGDDTLLTVVTVVSLLTWDISIQIWGFNWYGNHKRFKYLTSLKLESKSLKLNENTYNASQILGIVVNEPGPIEHLKNDTYLIRIFIKDDKVPVSYAWGTNGCLGFRAEELADSVLSWCETQNIICLIR